MYIVAAPFARRPFKPMAAGRGNRLASAAVRRPKQKPRRHGGAAGDETALVMKARFRPAGALLSVGFLTIEPGRPE
jgi:hypothetical protein